MSRTEDRLTDALDAVGRTVTDEDLRPLPDGSPLRVHAGLRRWLAPAAAAAAVVVIAGLVVTPILRHGTPQAAGGHSARPSAPAPVSANASIRSRCSPRVVATTSGGPAADHTGAAREVASGTVAGHPWSVWVKKGLPEPTALEDGGLVLSGRWYGMCAGYPNALEAELVDAGSRGIAYGYLADPGRATVSMTPAHAMQAPDIVRLPGVSVFVMALSGSACTYRSVTVDGSTTAEDDASHHLEFGTCQPGHDVAITASSGWWSSTSSRPIASALGCSFSAAGDSSGTPAAAHTAGEVEVATGTAGGQPWSLWSKKGMHGIDGIRSGGLVLAGRWYAMCGFTMNPGEFELIDSSPAGVVYGSVASPLRDAVRLTGLTDHQHLPAPATVRLQGGTFFIDLLPRSACDYPSMTLHVTTTRRTDTAYLTLQFGSCRAGQLVTVKSSTGGSAGDDW